MMHRSLVVLLAAVVGVTVSAQTVKPAPRPAAPAPAAAAAKSPGAGPVFVVETMKGTFEIETYPNEAPKTVEHVLALVKRNFYNGQRILRIVPNQLVQFGDPQTRDMTKQAWWGRGFDAGSGKSIGLAEFSKKRLHKVGSVSMAHPGDAREADSQMFISLSGQPKWNGQYTVFGQVISGMDVVRKLAVTDRIVKVTLRPEPAS
ncbi:MAG TPA: peptidylprolyl isomerase [Vicinamibacterales bacterium]